jgi:membrane protein implicated in regulation of membrane protease activity
MPGLSLDTLNCIYFALFFVGVGYALFIVITGGLSDIDMPDVDIDVPQIGLPGDVDIPGVDVHIGGPDLPAGGIDAPDVSVSPLSPITIATFVTVFGGVGVLALQLFEVDPRMSLLWATVSGLAVAALMYVFYSQVLIRSQGSSEIHRSDLIGLHGEVTVPIGETTAGQVSYRTKAGWMSSMARSVDGSTIPRGQFVRIVRTIGAQVLVEPLSPESAGEE